MSGTTTTHGTTRDTVAVTDEPGHPAKPRVSGRALAGRALAGRALAGRALATRFLLAALLVVSPATIDAQVEPIGDETAVNAFTTGDQSQPAVALDSEGSFVVVWTSTGSPGNDVSATSIQARRFDGDGQALGDQFQANTTTGGEQNFPTVTILPPRDDFVVAWTSQTSAGTDTILNSVQGQRFSADGMPLGAEFQINTYTTDLQESPSVVASADGGFVVIWQSEGSSGDDASGRSIQGQRFDAAGMASGDEFQINSYVTSEQVSPQLVTLGEELAAVWFNTGGSPGDDTSSRSIVARSLDATGPTGMDFQVNTYTTVAQYAPAIAAGPNGQFVIAWSSGGSSGSDSDLYSIQAQRFNFDGLPSGGEFQVNTFTTANQVAPSAAFTASGEFVVVWASGNDFSIGPDGDLGAVALQTLGADGTPRGNELVVNTYTTTSQETPAIASGPRGDLVVVWRTGGTPGGEADGAIRMQRYRDTRILFTDGFESGDTTLWTSTVGGAAPR